MSRGRQRWEALKHFCSTVFVLAVLASVVWYFGDSEWVSTVASLAIFFGSLVVIGYGLEIRKHSRWLRDERDDMRRVLKLPPRRDITDLEVK